MRFEKSNGIKVDVLPEQREFVGTPEMIETVLKREGVIAFDVFEGGQLIGFAMLREYKDDETGESCWFLWEYVIDPALQGKGYGKKALGELFELMQREYGTKIFTTTYIWGNTAAKNLYEGFGFVETDVVDEPDCHEVNMIYRI